jgi:hypothetical protein
MTWLCGGCEKYGEKTDEIHLRLANSPATDIRNRRLQMANGWGFQEVVGCNVWALNLGFFSLVGRFSASYCSRRACGSISRYSQ